MVRPIVNRFKDSESVAKAAAADLFDFLKGRLAIQERVDIAVTGGTVGIATLAQASLLPFNELDLSRVHIWWGDERFVESDSGDRNDLQAINAWFKKTQGFHLHRFPAAEESLTLQQAATQFNAHVIAEGRDFDLMLMGMGPDGHIASLFPDQQVGSSSESIVAVEDSPKPPPQRLSFSYQAINRAEEIWFTVAGADKANAVSVVFGDDPSLLPAGRIKGRKKTVWYLDQTAGSIVWGC